MESNHIESQEYLDAKKKAVEDKRKAKEIIKILEKEKLERKKPENKKWLLELRKLENRQKLKAIQEFLKNNQTTNLYL